MSRESLMPETLSGLPGFLMLWGLFGFWGGEGYARDDELAVWLTCALVALYPLAVTVKRLIKRQMDYTDWLWLGLLLSWGCIGFLAGDAYFRDERLLVWVGVLPTFVLPIPIWALTKKIVAERAPKPEKVY